jgi:hypothetical protein
MKLLKVTENNAYFFGRELFVIRLSNRSRIAFDRLGLRDACYAL